MASIATVSLRCGNARQFALDALAERVGAVDQPFLGDHVEHRERRRAGDRAAGIGAAEPARVRRVHDRGAADDARQRKAAGQRFGDGDQVRLDAGILDAEHLAGAREAGLHLVGDQQDAVLVADLAQRLAAVRSGAGWKPPSPCTGSMMIAATLTGSTSARNRIRAP